MTIRITFPIKLNKKEKDAIAILKAGLESIKAKEVIKNTLKLNGNILTIKNSRARTKKYDLRNYKNIYLVGFGKGSGKLAIEVNKILGRKIKEGQVNDNFSKKLGKIKIESCTHPNVSVINMYNTRKIFKIAEKAKEDDLVICIITGGGSAMFTFPVIGFREMVVLNKMLIRSGANIHEINAIRKHIDIAKGGWFARRLFPAKVISLIVSDVIGNDPSIIASGPTTLNKDSSYYALSILKKYDIPTMKLLPTPIESRYFEKIDNHIILTNNNILEAMKKQAKKLKYDVSIFSNEVKGDVKHVSKELVDKIKTSHKNCLIGAGETTVKITGIGTGGRNRELCLRSLKMLENDELLLAFDTDGIDNTERAGGAFVDTKIKKIAHKKKLDIDQYLVVNNSEEFFKKTRSEIRTGPLDTNVSDVFILLKSS